MRGDQEEQKTLIDEILAEINYGLVPVEEAKDRLLQMLEAALSGPALRQEDREKAALCISLLEKIEGSSVDEGRERSLDAVEKKHDAYKRRKRNRTRVFASAAAVLLLCVGLSAIKILPPIPGLFNGPSVEESKTIMEAAVAPEIIAGAVAAHQEAGTLYFSGETKGALMDFLGFDPQIPETIGWMYQAVAYSALIAPAGIRVRCTYQALGGDAERIDFKKYLYTDPGNVHTLCEEENHRPTQFTWTEGNAVFLIAASEGASIPETMVTQLLPREAAL